MYTGACSTLAIIPARGGSKGIPKKNLVNVAGKPLIQWTIEASMGARCITDTVVTSDDQDILDIAKRLGVNTLQRPPELAEDTTPSEPVIHHAVQTLYNAGHEYSYLILLQPTSPLRTAQHIDDAFQTITEHAAQALISVVEPKKHPLKAFTLNNDGYLRGLFNDRFPFTCRQELPAALMPNGAIYIVNINDFLRNQRLFQPHTIPYVMLENESLDIDSEDDIHTATLKLS